MALTRKKLDPMGCDTPNCDHDHSVLHFHQRCHSGDGVDVAYYKKTGTLHIVCHVCERPVATLQI